MVPKPYVCERDETTKAGDDEVEKRAWVLGEPKSVLGYQKTSRMLPRSGVSRLMLKYSGQP
jgi:hypothetical protein